MYFLKCRNWLLNLENHSYMAKFLGAILIVPKLYGFRFSGLSNLDLIFIILLFHNFTFVSSNIDRLSIQIRFVMNYISTIPTNIYYTNISNKKLFILIYWNINFTKFKHIARKEQKKKKRWNKT